VLEGRLAVDLLAPPPEPASQPDLAQTERPQRAPAGHDGTSVGPLGLWPYDRHEVLLVARVTTTMKYEKVFGNVNFG
jgi:hypothetical protein